jgi:hypothetical protein
MRERLRGSMREEDGINEREEDGINERETEGINERETEGINERETEGINERERRMLLSDAGRCPTEPRRWVSRSRWWWWSRADRRHTRQPCLWRLWTSTTLASRPL